MQQPAETAPAVSLPATAAGPRSTPGLHYTRDTMLALYLQNVKNRDAQTPVDSTTVTLLEDMANFPLVCAAEPVEPLAFLPMADVERELLASGAINSDIGHRRVNTGGNRNNRGGRGGNRGAHHHGQSGRNEWQQQLQQQQQQQYRRPPAAQDGPLISPDSQPIKDDIWDLPSRDASTRDAGLFTNGAFSLPGDQKMQQQQQPVTRSFTTAPAENPWRRPVAPVEAVRAVWGNAEPVPVVKHNPRPIDPSYNMRSNTANILLGKSSRLPPQGRDYSADDGQPMLQNEPHPMFYYLDPTDAVQGPFTAHEMQQWNEAGYFSSTLRVKLMEDERFVTLDALMVRFMGRDGFSFLNIRSMLKEEYRQLHLKRQQQQQQQSQSAAYFQEAPAQVWPPQPQEHQQPPAPPQQTDNQWLLQEQKLQFQLQQQQTAAAWTALPARMNDMAPISNPIGEPQQQQPSRNLWNQRPAQQQQQQAPAPAPVHQPTPVSRPQQPQQQQQNQQQQQQSAAKQDAWGARQEPKKPAEKPAEKPAAATEVTEKAPVVAEPAAEPAQPKSPVQKPQPAVNPWKSAAGGNSLTLSQIQREEEAVARAQAAKQASLAAATASPVGKRYADSVAKGVSGAGAWAAKPVAVKSAGSSSGPTSPVTAPGREENFPPASAAAKKPAATMAPVVDDAADLWQWCRNQLKPLGARVDVAAMLEVLSSLDDNKTICEVVHDSLGPFLTLVDPQQFLQDYLTRRHRMKRLPGTVRVPAPPPSSMYAIQRKSSSGQSGSNNGDASNGDSAGRGGGSRGGDQGFTPVIARKTKQQQSKLARKAAAGPVGVGGRPVVGASGLAKD